MKTTTREKQKNYRFHYPYTNNANLSTQFRSSNFLYHILENVISSSSWRTVSITFWQWEITAIFSNKTH